MPPFYWELFDPLIDDVGPSPAVSFPSRQIESRHAPCPPTEDISPPSQYYSVGVSCPVSQGPAGTTSYGTQGSPGIWKEAMETAPRYNRGPDLIGAYSVGGLYFGALFFFLFLSRLILMGGRSIRQLLDEMRPDPDAPWQATSELLQDDLPTTFRAHASHRWDEETHTLCGEEEEDGADALTVCEDDDDTTGQTGMDVDQSPASSSSGGFIEEGGRRAQRSRSRGHDWDS